MRKLFEVLSIFDWITPTVALIEDVAEGGPFNPDAWTFFVPYDRAIGRGWSAAHIENLLTQHGIKTWGGLVHFGEYFFKVNLEQAAWAEYILANHGIPLQKKSQGAPPSRRRRGRRRSKGVRRRPGTRCPFSTTSTVTSPLFCLNGTRYGFLNWSRTVLEGWERGTNQPSNLPVLQSSSLP